MLLKVSEKLGDDDVAGARRCGVLNEKAEAADGGEHAVREESDLTAGEVLLRTCELEIVCLSVTRCCLSRNTAEHGPIWLSLRSPFRIYRRSCSVDGNGIRQQGRVALQACCYRLQRELRADPKKGLFSLIKNEPKLLIRLPSRTSVNSFSTCFVLMKKTTYAGQSTSISSAVLHGLYEDGYIEVQRQNGRSSGDRNLKNIPGCVDRSGRWGFL